MSLVIGISRSSFNWSGEVSEAMEHQDAIEMMASEKYLLDELSPELREAYEEHFFGCTECALDVSLGAEFIQQAKEILPTMPAPVVSPAKPAAKPEKEKREWFSWLRPAIMAPVFASLLAIIGYQNLITVPALQVAALEPQVLPPATVLHEDVRGPHPVVVADRMLGTRLSVELPANVNYPSYKFDFYDSRGEVIWTHTAPSAESLDDMVSLWLPGGVKQDTYKLTISGVTSSGDTIPVEQQIFDLQIKK